MIEISTARGDAILAELPALAALRIAVFREFPYLYDGDADYERRYLGAFAGSPDAFVVLARSDGRLIGAATGAPMEQHDAAFAAPLAKAGLRPDSVYYCAESVLLPDFRGRGLGHRFFDAREAEATRLGRSHIAFFSVIRPADHPDRPPDYRPLDGFWKKRGYAPVDGAVAQFAWRDLGDRHETDKPLQLWMRTP